MSLQEMKERVRQTVSSKICDMLETETADMSDTEAMGVYAVLDPVSINNMMEDEKKMKFLNAMVQAMAPPKKSNRRVINPRALNAQKKTKAETKEA